MRRSPAVHREVLRLARSFRAAREASGYSVADLAPRAGVTEKTIRRLETGANVQWLSAQKVRDALDLPIGLIVRAGSMGRTLARILVLAARIPPDCEDLAREMGETLIDAQRGVSTPVVVRRLIRRMERYLDKRGVEYPPIRRQR